MRRSNRLILLIGVFLAAVVFILILSGIPGGGGGTGGGATPSPAPQKTVVAATNIPLGAKIVAAMLTVQTIDAAGRDANAFSDPSLVVDKIAFTEMTPGHQITLADVTPPSATLGLTHVDVPPGKRAIAVQVDQVSGVGTVIRKGDFVDAILLIDFPTTQIDQTTGAITVVQGIDSHSVKLLLQSMQVLGTLLPPVAPAASGAPQGEPGTTLNGQQEIVILAVDPQQAEVLRFAQTGTPPAPITLILRSPKDFVLPDGYTATTPPDVVTTGIVLKTLIDNYGVLTPRIVEAILPSPTPR